MGYIKHSASLQATQTDARHREDDQKSFRAQVKVRWTRDLMLPSSTRLIGCECGALLGRSRHVSDFEVVLTHTRASFDVSKSETSENIPFMAERLGVLTTKSRSIITLRRLAAHSITPLTFRALRARRIASPVFVRALIMYQGGVVRAGQPDSSVRTILDTCGYVASASPRAPIPPTVMGDHSDRNSISSSAAGVAFGLTTLVSVANAVRKSASLLTRWATKSSATAVPLLRHCNCVVLPNLTLPWAEPISGCQAGANGQCHDQHAYARWPEPAAHL